VGRFQAAHGFAFFFSWYSGLWSPAGKPWFQGPPPPASEICFGLIDGHRDASHGFSTKTLVDVNGSISRLSRFFFNSDFILE
jgi:hypothetical protein